MIEDTWNNLTEWMSCPPDDSAEPSSAGPWLSAIDDASNEQVDLLFDRLIVAPLPNSRAAVHRWEQVLTRLARRILQDAESAGDLARGSAGSGRASDWVERTQTLYERLSRNASSSNSDTLRQPLLRLLAASREKDAWRALAECLVARPLDTTSAAIAALSPLFHRRPGPWEALFPGLLETMEQPALAGVTLDLANFITRESLVAEHPAKSRSSQLRELLAGVVRRLEELETSPPRTDDEIRQAAAQIQEGIPLAVSLIDAIALIGDRTAAATVRHAMDLRHRRLQTEAAMGLVRLGDRETGIGRLKELAAFPVARLRALAYADEAGALDEMPEEFRSGIAQAEAELVCWLSEPAQFGAPPPRCELLDDRTMYWPGYDEPVDCFLFRFEYPTDAGPLSNIGLAGPMTFAFTSDVADLPADDIYAAFAGWSAEHAELVELDASRLTGADELACRRIARRLEVDGFSNVQPIRLGRFFGDHVLIGIADRDGERGAVVADDADSLWHPAGRSSRPIGPTEAYCIYKGRRLLRAFNP